MSQGLLNNSKSKVSTAVNEVGEMWGKKEVRVIIIFVRAEPMCLVSCEQVSAFKASWDYILSSFRVSHKHLASHEWAKVCLGAPGLSGESLLTLLLRVEMAGERRGHLVKEVNALVFTI